MDWASIITAVVTAIASVVGAYFVLRGQARQTAKDAEVAAHSAADSLRDDMIGWAKMLSDELRTLKIQHAKELENSSKHHQECLRREQILLKELAKIKWRVFGLERKVDNGNGNGDHSN